MRASENLIDQIIMTEARDPILSELDEIIRLGNKFIAQVNSTKHLIDQRVGGRGPPTVISDVELRSFAAVMRTLSRETDSLRKTLRTI